MLASGAVSAERPTIIAILGFLICILNTFLNLFRGMCGRILAFRVDGPEVFVVDFR